MELWIARDRDGLTLFRTKPLKLEDCNFFAQQGEYGYLPLDKNYFPEVTFENSPKKVELKLI